MALHQFLHDGGGSTIRDPAGGVVARVWAGNPAEETPPESKDGAVVCWSGWTGAARPEVGWFERTASAWLPSAATERTRVLERLVASGAIIRPHARHLISDIPACLNLVRQHEGVRVLLEPAAMLEPSMIGSSADHIERILGALGSVAWGIVLSDAAVRDGEGDAWCHPAAPGSGALDMEHLVRVAGGCAGPRTLLIERP